MKETPIYNCPLCDGEFMAKERVDNCCPHCGIELKHERINIRLGDKKKLGYRYVLARPNSESSRNIIASRQPPAVEESESEEGEMISKVGEWPKIYLVKQGEQVEPGKMQGGEYLLIFGEEVHIGWIYCPKCLHKLFQNMAVTTRIDQEQHCRRCKALVRVRCNPDPRQHRIVYT